MSITGGITDGSLFGGTGNDTFNFLGGRVSAVVDTGSGVDSVVLSDTLADTVTLTGALTSTTLEAGAGDDSIVIKSNVSAGLISLDAGSDTIDFSSNSVSALGTTVKGGAGFDVVSLTEQMILSSILPLMTMSSVDLALTPCSSLVPFSTT